MEQYEEKKLVEEARSSPEAFSQLYEQYYSRIFNYALRRTSNIYAAQDITSETFYKVLKYLWQFKWRNISFSSWVYKIATNEIRNYYRKQKNRASSLDKLMEEDGYNPVYLDTPESELMKTLEILQQHQDFLECQKKISELPVKYQEVLVLRYFEQKQANEIGIILGKPEGTVKSLIYRGLEKLRKSFEEDKQNTDNT